MKTEFIEKLKMMQLDYSKFKNANILITGANGLIASNLVEALIYLNRDMNLHMSVFALCRNEEKAKRRFLNILNDKGFHLLIQDVTMPLKSSVCFDYIFHAASSAHPGAFNATPVDVMKSNIIGTINLLEYCKGKNTRFMFVSSSEIYGENFAGVSYFDETMNGSVNPAEFRSCYPESKRASETLCASYKKQFGSDVVIVRPSYIYGKEIIDDNVRADAYFLRQVIKHQNIVMYSKGEQIRSYLYVNDCVSAMLFVMLKGESGAVYNIGNEDSVITLHDFAEKLARLGNVELVYQPDSRPEGLKLLKTTRCILKNEKLKKLGWKAIYSLDEGINDILH